MWKFLRSNLSRNGQEDNFHWAWSLDSDSLWFLDQVLENKGRVNCAKLLKSAPLMTFQYALALQILCPPGLPIPNWIHAVGVGNWWVAFLNFYTFLCFIKSFMNPNCTIIFKGFFLLHFMRPMSPITNNGHGTSFSFRITKHDAWYLGS